MFRWDMDYEALKTMAAPVRTNQVICHPRTTFGAVVVYRGSCIHLELS